MTHSKDGSANQAAALKQANEEVNTTLGFLLKRTQLFEKTTEEKARLERKLEKTISEYERVSSDLSIECKENKTLRKSLEQLLEENSLLYSQLFKVQESLDKQFSLYEILEKELDQLGLENKLLKKQNTNLTVLRDKTYEAIKLNKAEKKSSFFGSKREPYLSSFQRECSALISQSNFFDEEWYLMNNPDVALADMPAVTHYLLHGGMEGRDPGPDFSSSAYLEKHHDVEENRVNPLAHYLLYGEKEGRMIFASKWKSMIAKEFT